MRIAGGMWPLSIGLLRGSGYPLLPGSRRGYCERTSHRRPTAFRPFACCCQPWGTARKLVHRLKYQDRTDLARFMALWMLRASDGTVDSCDCIVPVPLHRHRFWRRRFNQSAELARHLAKATGKPLLAGTLLRVKPTERQVGFPRLPGRTMCGCFCNSAQPKNRCLWQASGAGG